MCDRRGATALVTDQEGAYSALFLVPGTYAGIRETRGVTTVNTVPSAATRAGDFSNYRHRNGNLIVIYDPLTTRVDAQGRIVCDPFPSNIIPADRLSQVGRNIASIYPLPNNGSGSLFVRFNDEKFRLDAPQSQANCCLPTPAGAASRFDLGPFVAGIRNTKLTTHGAAFNYSKVLSPAFVNEIRIGYAKPTGRVTGVRARGGFETDLSWRNGSLEGAIVRSRLGQHCACDEATRCGRRVASREAACSRSSATTSGHIDEFNPSLAKIRLLLQVWPTVACVRARGDDAIDWTGSPHDGEHLLGARVR